MRRCTSRATSKFEDCQIETLSIISNEAASGDKFMETTRERVEQLKVPTKADYVREIRTPVAISRDTEAISQGSKLSPHKSVVCETKALLAPFMACRELERYARQLGSHLLRRANRARRDIVGTNVFIGHGRSLAWLQLKNFVDDRLRLPWDEFNRVPIAGVTHIERLAEMLDAAAIALLVLTAEDEQADGEYHARMNVIHEAGLFQGRLGFSRAIVVLEEGCTEFSNIQGLGQIRFAKGNIAGAFEEIRRVLEREGLIATG